MSAVELGPIAVARVASVPWSRLSGFAEPALAADARAAWQGRLPWSKYEARYSAAMSARQEQLWALTAGDTHFMLALSFANPKLTQRVLASPPRAPRCKRRRHLETTLYRYLARAAGRVDPFGLWAGVSLVRWGKESRVVRREPQIRIEPELGPWFALVRQLGRTAAYRRAGEWQLNPSLARRPGGFSYWPGPHTNSPGHRYFGAHPGLAEVFSRLAANGPGDYPTLAETVASCCGSREAAFELLDTLIENALLVGGLQPAWSFATAWEALERTEEALLAPQRSAWHEARIAVRTLCSALEDSAGTLSPAEVAAGMARTTSLLHELARTWGVECVRLPDAMLRCDSHAALEIELGEDVRSRILTTLETYLRFQGAYGFGAAIRRTLVAQQLPQVESSAALGELQPSPHWSHTDPTWQNLCSGLGGDDDFRARIERWETLLAQSPTRVAASGDAPLPAPPFGWFQLSLLAAPGQESPYSIHGVHDDLWSPYARHAHFWQDTEAKARFEDWIREHLALAADQSGVQFAELVRPCSGSPNVAACPALGLPVASPWSVVPRMLDLQGAALRRSAHEQTPFLFAAGSVKPVVVLSTIAAVADSSDPISQGLLATSLASVPQPVFRAANMLFARECGRSEGSPEVTLERGDVVRTRRHVLDANTIQALRQGSPSRRFAAWAQTAAAALWPAHLVVRRAADSGLSVHRDSPFAIASALEGLSSSVLSIEQGLDEAWVSDGHERYLTQLSIPFRRRDHVFSQPVSSQPVFAQTARHPRGPTGASRSPTHSTELLGNPDRSEPRDQPGVNMTNESPFSEDVFAEPPPEEAFASIVRAGETLAVSRKKVVLRLLAQREKERQGLTVEDGAIRRAAADFRGRFGLEAEEDFEKWLASSGLKREAFDELIEEMATITAVESQLEAEIQRRLPIQRQLQSIYGWKQGFAWGQLNVALARDNGGPAANAARVFDALWPMVAPGSRAPGLQRFFLSRKPPDLRIRLGGTGMPSLLSEVGQLFSRLKDQGVLTEWYVVPYEPEFHRLGGQPLLDLVHAWFEVDSLAWMLFEMQHQARENRLAREVFSLAALNDLFLKVVQDSAEMWDIWNRVASQQALSCEPAAKRVTAVTVNDLLDRASTGEAEALKLYAQGNLEFAAGIDSIARQGRLTLGPRQILSTLALFHWNRYGIPTQTRQRVVSLMLCALHP